MLLKHKLKNILFNMLLIILFFFIMSPKTFPQILTVKSGSTNLFISNNAIVTVNGGLKIESGASVTHQAGAASKLNVAGKWNNLGTYTQNNVGILQFTGSRQDTITGNSPQVFYNFRINKSGGTSLVTMDSGVNVEIQRNLRLISNNVFNINKSNLILDSAAMIYPDSVSTYTTDPLTDPFSDAKHISTNGTYNTSGTIIRKFGNIGTVSSDKYIRFPIGTVNDTTNPTSRYYTPCRYTFIKNLSTFNTGSQMTIRCIEAEHPHVEVHGVALRKYWIVTASNMTIDSLGYNVRFDYHQEEVQGNEEAYLLCMLYRSNSYFLNKGTGYGVEPINNRFHVDEAEQESQGGILQLDGDWTAGQEEAVSNRFYSIADGDWTNPNTWSKQGYGGVPASSYPQTINDNVFVGNGKKVTVSATTSFINTITVDSTGWLDVSTQNAAVQGDSLTIKTGGKLGISSIDGIAESANSGNIQTVHRVYGSGGIYVYNGAQNQVTGDGLPDVVGALVVSNTGLTGDTVSLTKTVQIKDSLVINSGTFHLFKNGNFTANGETGDTTSRALRMRGGEFVMQTFPSNYKNPTFNAGTITFAGTGSFRVPSSANSTPGDPSVTQYYNLKIAGNRSTNTFITLESAGEIRIGGSLDISQLVFDPTPLTDRFIVTGSTVVFNGSGTQNIPSGYSSSQPLVFRLKFHNLVINGTGNKNILNPNDSDPSNNYLLVRNDLKLQSGNLVANNYEIRIYDAWVTTPGATFNPGTGKVTIVADGKNSNITSSGIKFYNLDVIGTAINGYVNYTDSLAVSGTLNINPAILRCQNASSLNILGNFYNNGSFEKNLGTIYFTGASGDQKFINNGIGDFYKIAVNKASGNVTINGKSLIRTAYLQLGNGNIGGRYSDSVANKPLVVDSSITRTGTGFVDGRLRLLTQEHAFSRKFIIGQGTAYAPLTLDVQGYGGSDKTYLEAYIQNDTAATNITKTVIQTDVPNGASMDTTKNIRRVWTILADSTTTPRFQLGASRTYSMTFGFPTSDTVGRGNPLNFEIRQRDTTINTGHWKNTATGLRTDSSTQFTGSMIFNEYSPQYFMVGEPKVFTYYSKANGNFSDTATWSTAGYSSSQPALRAPQAVDNIRIGNGKTVTLNQNYTINSNRTFTVECGGTTNQSGTLILGTNVISGNGTFYLDSGATLSIGDQYGITTSGTGGTSGNIRTATRNFNHNSHNAGNFIYTYSGGATNTPSVGNGLPTYVWTLKNSVSTGKSLTYPAFAVYHVLDSLHLNSGSMNLSNINFKLGGNLRIESGATFSPGNARLRGGDGDYFPYTGDHDSSSAKTGGFMFVGSGNQYIRWVVSDTTTPIVFNRLSLVKPSGKVISRNNLRCSQLIFQQGNRANLDMRDYNKYVCVYDTAGGDYNVLRIGMGGGSQGDPGFDSLYVSTYGFVEGRLLRYFSSNDGQRQFPIGTGTKYSPVILARGIGSSNGAVSGLIEVTAVDGNHPLFNQKGNNINQNTNIQRYWEITKPKNVPTTWADTNLVMGDRTLRAWLIFTQDEPRGGINPANSYTVFRLLSDSTWSNTANSALYNRDSTDIRWDLNTPSLGNNNIFTAQSQFSAGSSITMMIGETPPSYQERIFYSRGNGNWKSPSTWNYSNVVFANTDSGYTINSNSVNDYPRYNNASFRDYVYIGAGDTVALDTTAFNLAIVTVEKTTAGMGNLRLSGENYFKTNQFVLRNGGRIEVGSQYGINASTSATSGNIQKINSTDIINYDWNSYGINQFKYIGSQNQNTGTGLPTTVSMLNIANTGSSGNNIVTLTNDTTITVKDSLKFQSGKFQNLNGSRRIVLNNKLINNASSTPFDLTSNRAVIINSSSDQTLSGSADTTIFPQPVRITKTGGKLYAYNNVVFRDSISFYSNTIFDIQDNKSLTVDSNSAFYSLTGSFGNSRMVRVGGSSSTAKLNKIFKVGNNLSQTAYFPIGEDSSGLRSLRYSEATFRLNSDTFKLSNKLTLTLRNAYPHPNAVVGSPNMLKKYWSVATSNIARGPSGTVNAKFKYNDSAVIGNILNYKNTFYRRSDVTPEDPGWSFNLFNATNNQIDTLNKFLIIDSAQTLPNMDWTAGNPTYFQLGRKYWSRTTGNWRNPYTWTTYNNSGNPHSSSIPALNPPGYFSNDTVLIGSNHLVTMQQSPDKAIDSLGVGVTSPSTSPELRFYTVSGSNKSLNVLGSVNISATGLINKIAAAGSSHDTLRIGKNLTNNAGAGRGIGFHPDTSDNVFLAFNMANHSHLNGEGNYNSIGTVQIIKADSIYNFYNESQSFSNAVSASILSVPSVDFKLDAGQYYHDNAADITLSTDGDGDVFLGDLVGIVIDTGNVIFRDGLICGKNASVYCSNGNLTIGNQKNENFSYESITTIQIAGHSKLNIAGNLRRRFSTSAVDFRLLDSAQITVLIKGATTIDTAGRAAFDFGEATSFFTMTGGKVIILKPMDTSSAGGKDPDYYVAATNATVTGGTVQIGHPDTLYTARQPFSIISSAPIWNLDLVKTYGKDLLVGSAILTIKNNFTIGDSASFSQNGQNLAIGGDFTIDGIYKTGSTGTRRVIFNGDTSAFPPTRKTQTLKIKKSGNDTFYDVAISKPDSGSVVMSNSSSYPYSNIVLRNTLEFSTGNKGIIVAGDTSRYVQVGTQISDLAFIQRFGKGRVAGELRRWVNDGAQSKTFYVGTTTAYTPATVDVSSGSGTPGLLSVTSYGMSHPDLSSNSFLEPGTSVDRYWRIIPRGSTLFSLGASRTFNLTLQYVPGYQPTGDVKVGASYGVFEHFRRTLAYPDTGSWYTTVPGTRTDSTSQTVTHSNFGDFVIGEPAGLTYYTRASGDWDEPANWSIYGYGGTAAVQPPNKETDRVYIGNGDSITVLNSNPKVRSIRVETYNGNPGKLTILDERYVRGLTFELQDSCYLATDDAFGFTSLTGPSPNIGAVRTTVSRNYGKGTYEYIGQLAQATGDGPNDMKTLLINNSGTIQNLVAFSLGNYTVRDSILLLDGQLTVDHATINLMGNKIVQPGTKFNAGTGKMVINGTGNQYFMLNDTSATELYDLVMNKTSGNLIIDGSTSSNLYIQHNLKFDSSNVGNIDVRTNDRRTILTSDTTTITHTGSGFVDGILQRPYGSGADSFKFEVGVGNRYDPATISLTSGSGGTSGAISVIAQAPPNPSLARIDSSRLVMNYWQVRPENGLTLGTRTINTTLQFPVSEVANFSGGVPNNVYLLRQKYPNANPLWTQREYSMQTWNLSLASVSITNSADYWAGFGDFYIGEKASPTFYSRQNGIWTDNTTWTYSPTHSGIAVPVGEFPNPDSLNRSDNVYIGANHTVTLNVDNPDIDTLIIRQAGNLDMSTNSVNCYNCNPSKGLFRMDSIGTISFADTINASKIRNVKNFKDYIFSSTSTINLYGTQHVSTVPFELSSYPGNLEISGTGTKIADLPVVINGNLYVVSPGILQIDTEGFEVHKSVVNSGGIVNNKKIIIGQ